MAGAECPEHRANPPREQSASSTPGKFRGGTWHARLTVTVDGESIRKWFDLETDNRAVARRKMARLLAQRQAPTIEAASVEVARAETYAELAKRVTVDPIRHHQ